MSRATAQLTSFSVVASCGLLPRATRPGPRVRTAFWSVASPHPRDMNGRPGPSAVRSFVVDFERFEPSHGVQCHPERSEPASEVEGSAPRRVERLGRGSFASSHALRAPPGNENAPKPPPRDLFHRRLRMTLHLGGPETSGFTTKIPYGFIKPARLDGRIHSVT